MVEKHTKEHVYNNYTDEELLQKDSIILNTLLKHETHEIYGPGISRLNARIDSLSKKEIETLVEELVNRGVLVNNDGEIKVSESTYAILRILRACPSIQLNYENRKQS